MARYIASAATASCARKINNICVKTNDLADYLLSIQRSCNDNWNGMAADAFREKVLELTQKTNSISMELINITNRMNALAERYLSEEQEAERILAESIGDGGGEF